MTYFIQILRNKQTTSNTMFLFDMASFIYNCFSCIYHIYLFIYLFIHLLSYLLSLIISNLVICLLIYSFMN